MVKGIKREDEVCVGKLQKWRRQREDLEAFKRIFREQEVSVKTQKGAKWNKEGQEGNDRKSVQGNASEKEASQKIELLLICYLFSCLLFLLSPLPSFAKLMDLHLFFFTLTKPLFLFGI